MARGRGQWDRSLTPELRHAEHRRALLAALDEAAAAPGRTLTVEHVLQRAQVGRNTFYRHFPDLETAIRASTDLGARALAESLDAALRDARTPIEQLRSLTTAWLQRAAAHPGQILLLLEDAGPDGPRAVTVLEARLSRVASAARSSGAVGLQPDPWRLRALAGAFAECARHVARHAGPNLSPPLDTLVDLVLRALR